MYILSNKGAGITFKYSIVKRLFAGINMDGDIIGAKRAKNKKFYNLDASTCNIYSWREQS
jgi:lipid-binding SYLF domain-containing protein